MGDRFEDLWKAEVERFGDQAALKITCQVQASKKAQVLRFGGFQGLDRNKMRLLNAYDMRAYMYTL